LGICHCTSRRGFRGSICTSPIVLSCLGSTHHQLQFTILYSRYGSGIATNNLMKIVAGAVLPGRPLANLYFSSWSHSVISQSLNMASDLKMGEYRESTSTDI
jgi:hypothetical protein